MLNPLSIISTLPLGQHLIGLLGAAAGAVIARIFETWLNSDKLKAEDVYEDLRKDVSRLQEENDSLKDDNVKLRKESDKWRAKYWAEIESKNSSIREIAEDLDEIKEKLSDEKE